MPPLSVDGWISKNELLDTNIEALQSYESELDTMKLRETMWKAFWTSYVGDVLEILLSCHGSDGHGGRLERQTLGDDRRKCQKTWGLVEHDLHACGYTNALMCNGQQDMDEFWENKGTR